MMRGTKANVTSLVVRKSYKQNTQKGIIEKYKIFLTAFFLM